MALTKVTNSLLATPPTDYDDSGLQDDIALIGFKVASNGSLAKYDLVDQTIDAFEDTSGVDASASTNEERDSSGKYYKGISSSAVSSTGGTITTYGDYTIHKFTADGTYNVAGTVLHDFLIVGGGGGGGTKRGGGGGAGGLVYKTGESVTASTNYTIDIGAGGSGGVFPGGSGYDSGDNGDDTTAFGYTALGGGGGGVKTSAPSSGGSGGGGGRSDGVGQLEGGDGNQPTHASGGFGNKGAMPNNDDGPSNGGMGGGGAGAVGGTDAGSGSSGGYGGVGKAYTILDGSTSVYYAGGGGGGNGGTNPGGDGGNGGGGAGGGNGSGTSGSANTGGGGGGAGDGWSGFNGGNGGSGIVIIKRPTNAVTEGGNMTLVSTTTAAQAAPTKGDIVLTYTNGAGSTTLGTDLTAEISADGGSTWTAMTLGSEGSTGSHNIATAHDVTISSTITAPYNMAYRIKTLNQSASKTTRIQAVSLGWS